MSRELSAPLLRTARLLDLVPFLHNHQGISLKELAQHFEVTTKQMSADLSTLWMCGLPGYTHLELMNLNFESGFVTIANAETLSKPRRITFQEGVALLLGLDLIASALPIDRQDLSTDVESLRDRLTAKLGVPVKLSVVASTSGSTVTTIAQAIESGSGVLIQYHSIYKDEVSERTVKPTDMYESEGHQYLRAYCFTALDNREFRIDRIKSATPTEVSTYVENPNQSVEKIKYAITIKVPSRDVTERFGIAHHPVGTTVELSSYSPQWIERSVMASAGAVTLTTPSQTRSEISKKAQLMLNRYKQA
jgi:proteasome accessory factor C